FLRREEEATCDLHGDRRSALAVSTLAQVNPAGLQQSPIVHAVVMEKSAVFNGGDRINHDLGNVVVLDEAALGAQLAIEQAGDKLGLKLVSGEIARVAKRGNLLHAAIF